MKNISLIISLIGILLLLLIINFQEPKKIEISTINKKFLNKQIKTTGTITNTNTHQNNFTLFNLKDITGQIQAICNCPNIKQYKNQKIEVIGKITQYNHTLQIQADKIILIK